jgi:spore coat polysaccharide biosynthesis predicted glycosyltransferase SpsG
MIKEKSLSIIIGGSLYGNGHIKRALILNKILKKNKIENKIICLDGIKSFHEDIINIKLKRIDELKKIIKNKIIFFDISNEIFFKNFFFKKFIKEIVNLNFKPIFFDNYSPSIINLVLKTRQEAIIVCPYFSKKKVFKDKNKIKVFHGPDYFLYDKIYANKNKKKKTLDEIIISCGGLDKNCYTSLIIKEILNQNKKIKLHVVIGPFFSKINKKKIFLLRKRNRFKIYNNVKNITKISKNCDLAIVSSGLTKYEMLISKIDLAVFCENKTQLLNNKNFKKQNFSYDLSLLKNKTDLKNKIYNLLNNYDKIFNKIDLIKKKNFNYKFRFHEVINYIKKVK